MLVHCLAGQSRSAATVAAHLMRCERLSAVRALAEVTARRPNAAPNHGFVEQLQQLGRALGTEEEPRTAEGALDLCAQWAPMKAVRG